MSKVNSGQMLDVVHTYELIHRMKGRKKADHHRYIFLINADF